MFGGQLTGSMLVNEVWTLDLASPSAWVQMTPAGTPPTPRRPEVAVYDPTADRLLIIGGYDGINKSDVWALSFSGTPQWTQLLPSGAPFGKDIAVFDPVRNRILKASTSPGTGVFELSLSGAPTWTQISTMPFGVCCEGVYDPARDRIVVVGKTPWEMTLSGTPAWRALAPSGSGPVGLFMEAIMDPSRDRAVGYDDQPWFLNFNPLADVSPPADRPIISLAQSYPNPTEGDDVIIRFAVSQAGWARIAVYDLAGRLVRELMREAVTAGGHVITWDRRGARGTRVAPGIYLYTLQSHDARLTRRLIIGG